jgi:hypothetical protein
VDLVASFDEVEDALPGIRRGLRELRGLPVEEAVRGACVRDDLMLDISGVQRGVEGCVVLRRDVLVISGLEGEDRRRERCCELRRSRLAIPLACRAVEANCPREIVASSGGKPLIASAEAETDREDRCGALSP